MPPRIDDRLYDSDHEEYDSEDEAVTLALGTLMLRKSRAKKLVDASYNRFAWNDPADLPEWFVDDEVKKTHTHVLGCLMFNFYLYTLLFDLSSLFS